MPEERVIRIRPRTILAALAVTILVGVVLTVVWLARQGLTWVLVSFFLALALNPAVEWLQARGLRRRGLAAFLVYVIVLVAIGGILAAFIPPLVDQVNSLIQATPGYTDDLTRGRGPLGELAARYDVVDRLRRSVQGAGGGGGGAVRVLGGAGAV